MRENTRADILVPDGAFLLSWTATAQCGGELRFRDRSRRRR